MVVVDVGDESAALSPGDLMPAMPRDRHDLERWGRWWWWCDGEAAEAVDVTTARPSWTEKGYVLVFWRSGDEVEQPVHHRHDWRGPVAPPPEVRS